MTMDEGEPLRRDPLWHRGQRRLRRGGFRTVELNAVGWSALVGTGLVLGGVAALLTPVRTRVLLPLGMLLTWAGVLVADYVRWRSGTVGIGFGDLDEATARRVVDELGRRGITVAYREYRDDGDSDPQRVIECRNADAARVHEAVSELLGFSGRGPR